MSQCNPHTYLAASLTNQSQELFKQLTDHLAHESRLVALSQQFIPDENYPHAPHCYSRNILYRADSGAQVMVARWDQGARTAIHGHPQFAFVYVLQGQLQMEQFEQTTEDPVLLETLTKTQGQHIYASGVTGQYDNAIHRVTALAPSLSLHVYSDDALKGKSFS